MLGAEHPDTLTSMNNLAGVLGRQGKYDEALILYKRTCSGLVKVLGQEHPHTRSCYKNYSHMLGVQRQSHSGSGSNGIEVAGENRPSRVLQGGLGSKTRDLDVGGGRMIYSMDEKCYYEGKLTAPLQD